MSTVTEASTAASSEVAVPAVDRGRATTLALVFLLLAAGWGVYSRVTGFQFIPVDDPFYVYANPAVLHGFTWEGTRWAFTSFEGANWHPLTWLSLMADAQMYGRNPGGYHLTNLLLHELATILLFVWLVAATGRRWPSAGVAMLFCVHPAHVESVAWVTERKDVLSTVFFLLVLLTYTRYAQTKRRGCYLGALLALILGLLAKPMLVTVPPLLLLLDAWPLGRVRRVADWISLGVEKLPFALVAAASCVVTFIAQHGSGAVITMTKLPLSWRVANAVTGYVFYVGKLCWPVDLGIFYPYWTRLPLGRTLFFGLALVAVTTGTARWYRSRPHLLVGWLWFVGTLVPVIGLVQVGSQAMADRYTYQPSIGLFIALCWTLAECWQAWPRLRLAVAAGSVAAVAACLVLCYQQVGYWRDGRTLLGHTLAVTRPEAGAYTMVGDFFAVVHRPVEAEAAYRRGFKLEPANAGLVTKLGLLQLDQGHWAAACQWLRQVASRAACTDPVVFNSLGVALSRLGRWDEARATLERSLALRPDDALAHSNLAEVLVTTGQPAAAEREYEAALASNPDLSAALAPLAWLYSFADQARNPLRAERALALARRAVDLSGGEDVPSLDALAAAQAAVNDWPAAAASARVALTAAAGQSGASADLVALHRERVEFYRAGRWPER